MAFAMGEELLAEPVDFEVGPDSVQHLSTAQLAIASLRTDLDVLVRQRAYGIYLTRQNAARVGTLRPGDELFSVESNPTAAIPALSPAQLLTLQFMPEATQDSVDAAGRAFFARASAARLGALSQMEVMVFKLEREDEDIMAREDLSLLVGPARLTLVQGTEDELFACEGADIVRLKYLGGAQVGEKQECSLRITCHRYHRRGREIEEEGIVATLYLGLLATDDPAFATLRAAIKKWKKASGFVLEAEDVKSAIPEISSPIRYRRVVSPPPRRERSPRDRSLSPIRPAKRRERSRSYDRDRDRSHRRDSYEQDSMDYSPEPNGGGHLERPVQRLSTDLPSWRHYVSNQLQSVDWCPGYWSRLAAFLQAVDTRAALPLPTFSHAEVVFLSFRADPNTLPIVPSALDTTRRFDPRRRIATERIFRDQPGRLHVEQTRYLLTSDEFPDLKDYALSMEKVVACRDVFQLAFAQLEEHLRSHLGNSKTRDPVDRILPIVSSLARWDAPARHALFCDPSGRPCLEPHPSLSVMEIGSPARRYADSLREIVRFEQEAVDALLPPGWPKVL